MSEKLERMFGPGLPKFLFGPAITHGPFKGQRMIPLRYETPNATTSKALLEYAKIAEIPGERAGKLRVVPVFDTGGVVGMVKRRPLVALVIAGSGLGAGVYGYKKLRSNMAPKQESVPTAPTGGWQ
jgi:hypothetical protein